VAQIEAQLQDPGLNVCVSFEKLLASVKCFTIYRTCTEAMTSRSTTIPLGVDQHIGDVLDIAHLPFAVAGIGCEPDDAALRQNPPTKSFFRSTKCGLSLPDQFGSALRNRTPNESALS
jgi:hypothetical protein